MLSGPGPPHPTTLPPNGIPPPDPSGPAQLERTHANQKEGGRWRMLPASSRDRCTIWKGKRATSNFLAWQRARNDDTNKRLQPYLCRAHCPPQAGRGQPKRPRALPHRGEGKQDHPGTGGKQQGQKRRLPT